MVVVQVLMVDNSYLLVVIWMVSVIVIVASEVAVVMEVMLVVMMLRFHEYLVKCLIETPLGITTKERERESNDSVVTRYTANYCTPG